MKNQGLPIHIRTTWVDKLAAKYSYISGAAIAIGSNILEVLNDDFLIINGDEASSKMNDGGSMPITSHGEVVTKTFKWSKQAAAIHDIALLYSFVSLINDDTAQSVQIRTNTSTRMILHEVNGSNPDNVGMTGNPKI